MTVLEEQQHQQAEQASTSGSAADQQKAGSSKWVIDENELLTSTAEHRAWTFGAMGVMGAALAVAASHVDGGAGGLLSAASAVLAAYVLSDLGTGVYHWGVDNYGDGKTPVFGRQIAAFQGHHQRPWTITQREFCNNVHQVFKPAVTPGLAILAVSPFLPVWAGFFLPSFLFLVRACARAFVFGLGGLESEGRCGARLGKGFLTGGGGSLSSGGTVSSTVACSSEHTDPTEATCHRPTNL